MKASRAAAAAASPRSLVAAAGGRRALLVAVTAAAAASRARRARADLAQPPRPEDYDERDARLLSLLREFQAALDAPDVATEEKRWTVLAERLGRLRDAPDPPRWADDTLARVLGNRGNARSRMGRFEDAVVDFDTAIVLAPYAVDPVLNRGVVLEQQGEYAAAIRDYTAVLALAPDDPAAWNNLGNASAGTGDYERAVECYSKAVSLAPEFSFAAANRANALFELRRDDEALRAMRALLRRYPEFPEVRAALTAALYAIGKVGEAETQWQRCSDTSRYRDRAWLGSERRWPPRLVGSMQAFLDLKPPPT